jgi:hypothetical protein
MLGFLLDGISGNVTEQLRIHVYSKRLGWEFNLYQFVSFSMIIDVRIICDITQLEQSEIVGPLRHQQMQALHALEALIHPPVTSRAMKDTLSLANPRFHATAQGCGAIILRAWV